MSERTRLFLRASLPDFALCLAAAALLTYVVSFAFESAPDLRGNVLVCAGLAAPLLAVLFAGSYDARAVPFAAGGAVAYAALVVGMCALQLPEGVPMFADGGVNDVAENPAVFALVALVVTAAVFLLSRRRVGGVALLAACALSCAVVQFLYRDFNAVQPGTLAAVAAIAVCGALYVYRGFRLSLADVERAGEASFAGAAGAACAIAALCAGLACACWLALVSPLGLETPQLKPFQDYYVRPVVEYTGVYQEQQIDDPDQQTDELEDEQDETNDNAEGGQQEQAPDEQDVAGSPISALIETVSSFDPSNWTQAFSAISYQQVAWGALVAALALLVAAATGVLLRRRWRRVRLERLSGEEPAYRAWYLTGFLQGRLAKLGTAKAPTLTPLEFALAYRAPTAPYFRGGADLLAQTLIAQRAAYAPETLTDEDVALVERTYWAFYKNARRQLGARRWLWWFWRL